MTNNRHQGKKTGAAHVIHREVGNRANHRLVRKLPAFAVENELPKRLRNLLDQLDTAEGRAT